jgi:hypothetical protein
MNFTMTPNHTESAITINYKLAYEKAINTNCKKIIETILADIKNDSIKTFYFIADETIFINSGGKPTCDLAANLSKLYVSEFKKLGLQMFKVDYKYKSDNSHSRTYDFYISVDTN